MTHFNWLRRISLLAIFTFIVANICAQTNDIIYEATFDKAGDERYTTGSLFYSTYNYIVSGINWRTTNGNIISNTSSTFPTISGYSFVGRIRAGESTPASLTSSAISTVNDTIKSISFDAKVEDTSIRVNLYVTQDPNNWGKATQFSGIGTNNATPLGVTNLKLNGPVYLKFEITASKTDTKKRDAYIDNIVVEGSHGREYVNVSSARWATFAPSHNVELPAAAYEQDPAIRIYYVRNQIDNESVGLVDATTIVEQGRTIAAGTGILVKAEAGNYPFTVNATGNTRVLEGNLLKGVTTTTTKPEGAPYIFKNGSQGIGFYPWLSGTLAANKCYLDLTDINYAPSLISLNDDIDAIETLLPAEDKNEGAAYNLSGQRVDAAYRGLIIQDGRKVLVKP